MLAFVMLPIVAVASAAPSMDVKLRPEMSAAFAVTLPCATALESMMDSVAVIVAVSVALTALESMTEPEAFSSANRCASAVVSMMS